METTSPSTLASAEPGATAANRNNLGFLLAKASQHWNELLYERFVAYGFPEVRPAYGSILVPLFEEDELRMGELARRALLAKQTMTTMVRLLERDGLVKPRARRGRRTGLPGRASHPAPGASGRSQRESLRELDETGLLAPAHNPTSGAARSAERRSSTYEKRDRDRRSGGPAR